MNTRNVSSYINDFLYFVVRPDRDRARALIYCSGVNITRFSPLTRGRHGIGSNPALRGLQLVNLGVRALALEQGAKPKALRSTDCTGIAPTAETWYTERLLIENARGSFPLEVISYCVPNLLRKIFRASMLDFGLPEVLPRAEELQAFIEGLIPNIPPPR